jgi:dienelactone hydrolase
MNRTPKILRNLTIGFGIIFFFAPAFGIIHPYPNTGLCSIPTSDKNLVLLAEKFLHHLIQNETQDAIAMFDETMTRALPPEKLEKMWPMLQLQAGKFEEIQAARTDNQAGYRIVFLTCRFTKSLLDLKVVFDKEDKIAGLFFLPTYSPPPYEDPAAYREEELTFGEEPWILPGTLSLPKGEGPYPAVVLVHGSGPNDRDETIGPNKPFRDLAGGLASRGIAVFRHEKRTKQYKKEFLHPDYKFTVQHESIDDALAAVDMLRHRKDIDPDNIFVLGHSLGGMLIPRIGRQDTGITGFIILAGATEPGEDEIIRQTEYIFNLDGKLTEDEKSKLEAYKALAEEIKNLKPEDAETNKKVYMGAYAPYWLDLRGYDPPAVAATLSAPMLILQGERDYQVLPSAFDRWKTALQDRNNVSFKLYPDLNHLFIPGKGKSTPNEYQRPGHVDVEVISDIAVWIKQVSD